MRNIFWIAAFCCFIFALPSHAQTGTRPTLSVQGILKKANGVAVDDGTYSMTFRLYTEESGGTAIWSENQSNIDVSSGIYSATLGTIEPLNAAFTQLYYLGVSIGATEMKPRVLLTSAPYALALIGQSNRFPSSGKVVADTVKIATTLEVGGKITASGGVSANGGILAGSGAPGAAGANNKGYGFNGDGDTGLFSTGDGKAVLYSNNTEIARADAGGLVVQGTVTSNGVNISNNNLLSYNGVSDWRLVVQDYGMGGWGASNNGWNTGVSYTANVTTPNGSFAPPFVSPNNNNDVLKKFYSLNNVGNYSYILIKFKYYFLDSWDFGDNDRAWAGFSPDPTGSKLYVAWQERSNQLHNTGELNPNNILVNQGNFAFSTSYPDFSKDVQMTAVRNGSGFWLFVGAALDGDVNDERYGVGMVEVWVK